MDIQLPVPPVVTKPITSTKPTVTNENVNVFGDAPTRTPKTSAHLKNELWNIYIKLIYSIHTFWSLKINTKYSNKFFNNFKILMFIYIMKFTL